MLPASLSLSTVSLLSSRPKNKQNISLTLFLHLNFIIYLNNISTSSFHGLNHSYMALKFSFWPVYCFWRQTKYTASSVVNLYFTLLLITSRTRSVETTLRYHVKRQQKGRTNTYYISLQIYLHYHAAHTGLPQRTPPLTPVARHLVILLVASQQIYLDTSLPQYTHT